MPLLLSSKASYLSVYPVPIPGHFISCNCFPTAAEMMPAASEPIKLYAAAAAGRCFSHSHGLKG